MKKDYLVRYGGDAHSEQEISAENIEEAVKKYLEGEEPEHDQICEAVAIEDVHSFRVVKKGFEIEKI